MKIERISSGRLLPHKGKAAIIYKDGARPLSLPPKRWRKGLVCVVEYTTYDVVCALPKGKLDVEIDMAAKREPPPKKQWFIYSLAETLGFK